jgi:Tol biopolymer transport system component
MKARPLILFAFVVSIAWLALLLRAGGQPMLAQGTGNTERVSIASDGTEANNLSNRPWISADGRYVAFVSGADNLVSGDTNNTQDIFVHDLQTGQTSRVSVASDGTEARSR